MVLLNNKIALGTVQFGLNYGIANQHGQVSLEVARTIVELALASGMDTLDTAITYGLSEQRLGEIGIQDCKVVSKLPAVPPMGGNEISEWIMSSLKFSLQRLRIKKLYGLLLHQPQQLLEQNGDHIYHALQQLKHNGLVQKIGISIYDTAELDSLCKQFKLDMIQAPFNIFDRRLIDSGWLFRLAQEGIELHVRSIFLQGLLLMEPSHRPKKFERWTPLWAKWDEWIKDSGMSPLDVCLRYALSFQEIAKVIVGIDSLKQLTEILQAVKVSTLSVPMELKSCDNDLINPSRWNTLT